MSLSLTTSHKQQTLPAKWSTQQHLVQHLNADVTATNANIFRHHQHQSSFFNQTLRKQKSFIDNFQLNKNLLTKHTGRRAHLSRGLSVGRSHDAQQQQALRRHSSITAQNCNGTNGRETSKTEKLITNDIKTSEKVDVGRTKGKILRNSRTVQGWSSTSSILKSLDKELAQLNGVVGRCKDVNAFKEQTDFLDNVKANKPRTDSKSATALDSSHSTRKLTNSEVNKVNLSIVLSHTVDSSKEEHDGLLSDQEVDEEGSDDTPSNSGNIVTSLANPKEKKGCENSSDSLKSTSAPRQTIPAQQRRILYHTSRQTATNLTTNLNNININGLNSGIQNPENFNNSPSLTVQKRPPLIRAMSAPVRSFDETTKGSFSILNTKRKSRRRKLNTRNISCDKGSDDHLTTNDFHLDSKSTTNRKVLTRSKSVAPDVVTLVSLISSEGSDSEKEENTLTTKNTYTGSPNRRAPSLRKSGKSVSFQENYPPTYQFASKEYSHMLRRGSIAALNQRSNLNRPPTAPPGSVYRTAQTLMSKMAAANTESSESKESNLDEMANKSPEDKTVEDQYEFPKYVHSLKERECWKLFQKMSTKGVSITYDTILRGMLTPTEFRQFQKQRDIEEARAMKEVVDNGLVEEGSKRSPTAIERLKESLLKN